MNNQNKIIFGALIIAVIGLAVLMIINGGNKNNIMENPGKDNNLSPLPETGQVDQGTKVFYSCNEGKTIEAVFRKGQAKTVESGQLPVPSGSAEIKLNDGRAMTLPQMISADGGRYANADESFVFWIKGEGALVLENNQEKSYIGCVRAADQPQGSDLFKVYSNGADGFSIRLPQDYKIDETYKYQLKPGMTIGGVEFTIPESMTEGTNLFSDTYVSVELLPQTQDCTASLFLDGDHSATEKIEGDRTYSVAEASNAGAGNRYEETIWALPGANPCVAVRYFVHYGVIQNYLDTVKEFDKQALLKQFDLIRSTLVINQ